MDTKPTIRVAELIAGVGGFRLALDGYYSAEHSELEKPAVGVLCGCLGEPMLPQTNHLSVS